MAMQGLRNYLPSETRDLAQRSSDDFKTLRIVCLEKYRKNVLGTGRARDHERLSESDAVRLAILTTKPMRTPTPTESINFRFLCIGLDAFFRQRAK